MSGKPRSAEYHRNARRVRSITDANLKAGRFVRCVGCGREIQKGQRYDVGHIIDSFRGGDDSLRNLGPQHRGENRSAGGRAGAATQHHQSRRARRLPTTW